MKLYVYDLDTLKIVAIAEGETNKECEDKADGYSNDYGFSYTKETLIDGGNYEVL